LKVSEEELEREGRVERAGSLRAAAEELRKAGTDTVVVSLGDERALVMTDGCLVRVVGPHLEPVETRGAGDSLTAGVVAGLARGLPLLDAVTIGAAAGALNVTRRGLATGAREQIERLTRLVAVEEVAETDAGID
jgi:1-phosphofructokinase